MPSFRVSVTRPLDLDRFTDRWVMGALFAFGGTGYWRGGWAEAVQAGLASYLAWAISREIDPDHPASATMAAVAGGLLALALHIDIGALFVILLAAKVMVAGSGLSPARWEAGLLGAGALVFTGSQTGWWMAMAMAAALLMDTATQPLAAGDHRYIAAALAVVAWVVYWVLDDAGPWWWAHLAAVAAAGLVISYLPLDLYHRSRLGLLIAGLPALIMVTMEVIGGNLGNGPWWVYWLMAGGLVSGTTMFFVQTEVRSLTDHADHPISSERVNLARCLVATAAIASWGSQAHRGLAEAVEAVAPLWALLCLVGLRELISRRGLGIGKKQS